MENHWPTLLAGSSCLARAMRPDAGWRVESGLSLIFLNAMISVVALEILRTTSAERRVSKTKSCQSAPDNLSVVLANDHGA